MTIGMYANRTLTEFQLQLRRLARPQVQRRLLTTLGAPLMGIGIFLLLWQLAAQRIDTSLGALPGPAQVLTQAGNLYQEHKAERDRAHAFMARQHERNAQRLAQDPEFVPVLRPYAGAPTLPDQIKTSLVTVLVGFGLASLIAVPLGVAMGLSPFMQAAISPLVQLLRPISPLAWLPLVTLVVAAVYTSANPLFSRAFVVSAITVTLCCLWPTLINTAAGVSRIDVDLNNVSRVLRLGWLTHVRRIVLPSAIPMIFTGLRVSLGIAWMVLIAAEMLAQSPGLGKFVWDEFQNGSSHSLSRIMVAVILIGLIGLILDRLMLALQRLLDWQSSITRSAL